jgi:hypothetical protein
MKVPPAAVDVTLCESNGIACFCCCFAEAGSRIGGKLVREGELTLKRDVIRRSTDRHLIGSWQSNPLLGRFVPVSKGTQVQRLSHCFGFTRLQVNPLEAFQFLDWPINGRILLADVDVELSYLSTGAFAGIGHRETHVRADRGSHCRTQACPPKD